MVTIWSRQRVAQLLPPPLTSRPEQRNRAKRRDGMATLARTPVLPEAILQSPLSALLRPSQPPATRARQGIDDRISPFLVLRRNRRNGVTLRVSGDKRRNWLRPRWRNGTRLKYPDVSQWRAVAVRQSLARLRPASRKQGRTSLLPSRPKVRVRCARWTKIIQRRLIMALWEKTKIFRNGSSLRRFSGKAHRHF